MTPEQETRVAAAAMQGQPLVIAGMPYEAAKETAASSMPSGVWAAYYVDGSAVWVFDLEIDALRCGVEKSAQVRFWPFGCELGEVQ